MTINNVGTIPAMNQLGIFIFALTKIILSAMMIYKSYP